MKKTAIFIFILLCVSAALPIIGNQIIEETLEKKITKLESKGMNILKKERKSGYFNTSRHYEILLDETKYGIDLKYSNIPFTEAVSLDLYPLSVPLNILNDLEKKDKGFANFIKGFVAGKGILYHINYNLMDANFDGFIKDIDEIYTMKNNSIFKIRFLGASFKGNSDAGSPFRIETFVKKIHLLVEDRKDLIALDIANIELNASVYSINEKVQLDSQVYFENMYLISNNKDLNISSFDYDANFSNIDMKAYKEFLGSKQSKKNLVKLLSQGVDINIAKLSLKNINRYGKDLKGFTLSSDMHIKADKNLAFKVRISPLLALSNLEIDFKSKISKKIIDEIVKDSFIPKKFMKYRTSSGDDVVFDFSYESGVLIVNGKTILG